MSSRPPSSSQQSKSPQQLLRPNKLFFRIGEVSRITGLEPYVLRYWETEFPHLRPDASKSGHRLYTQKDLDNILQVKQLLYKEGFTISGARKRLRGRPRQDVTAVIEQTKQDIRQVLAILG
jgi:DNA-binding transcriptional MerR regulator